MHLNGNTLERYVARDLHDVELATLDEHVSNCIFCADAMARDGATSDEWERRGWLGRLVRIDPGPIAAYDPGKRRQRAA